LIFVSHDRWLVSQLADRIFEITDSGINDYPGTYEEYLASCGDDHLDAKAADLRVRRKQRARKKTASEADTNVSDSLKTKKSDQMKLRLEVVTAAIEKAETRIEAIDTAFCKSGFFEETSEMKIRAMQKERDTLATDLDRLMNEWEEIEAALEER
jgi:ATPase subunit of ABC transporter with duplicated ATPase domains